MFHSIPFTSRKLVATESRLESIYAAAKQGLVGDSLALAAGMLPIEYRALCEFDPMAALAAAKGKADNEMEMTNVLRTAALDGDVKAALAVLTHRHDWQATQRVHVEVSQQISILQALHAADARVIEGTATHAHMIPSPPFMHATPVQDAYDAELFSPNAAAA
jgi:hypothetical protein